MDRRVFLLEEFGGRAQSNSSVSPRGNTNTNGGYCSSASTPHSSNGGSSYTGGGNMNGYSTSVSAAVAAAAAAASVAAAVSGSSTPTSINMMPGSPNSGGAGLFNTTPISPEGAHYPFNLNNGPSDQKPLGGKSAFAPVVRAVSPSPVSSSSTSSSPSLSQMPPYHQYPAPALFHHQPVTGWHHLAVQ